MAVSESKSYPCIVSVVVTTFNRPEVFRSCLQHLSSQDFGSYEIVVVDDYSDCKLSVENQATCLKYGNIKYIRNDINKGLALSRSVGVDNSNGQYILFVDDDILVDSGYISGHVKVLKNGNLVATVASLRHSQCFVSMSNTTKFISSRELRQRRKIPSSLGGHFFGGGISGVSRVLYERLSGFDSEFRKYGSEDVDFGLRLIRIGAEIVYVKDATADHYDLVTLDRLRRKSIENARYGITYMYSKFGDISILGKAKALLFRLSRSAMSYPLYVVFRIIDRVGCSLLSILDRRRFLYSATPYVVLQFVWVYIGFYLSECLLDDSSSNVKYSDL